LGLPVPAPVALELDPKPLERPFFIMEEIENCQTVVFLACVTACAHTLFDFRLYLPRQWSGNIGRRNRARVPEDEAFTTKTEQGTEMVTGAVSASVPFSWLAGDEVYGRSSRLRAACEKAGKGYVLAVPVNFKVTTAARPRGRRGPGQARPGPLLGDPHLREGLQRPPRLPAGDNCDQLPASLAADPPQDHRPC